MPIYQYVCDKCQTEHEVFQGMKEKHEHTCPDCGNPTRRKFTATPFKFKFWYGYDKGLGAYCDTEADKKRIMEEKNLIEQ